MTDDVDALLDLATEAPPPATLEGLAKLADDQTRLEAELAQAEEAVKTAQERLQRVSDKLIPEMMNSLGVKKYTFTNGSTLEVQDLVSATIPKATQAAAYQWLRDQGHGDIIKNEVVLSFGAGEEDDAKKVVTLLREQHYDPMVEENIHASTLKAFVREQRKAYVEFPADLIKVWEGQRAKISRKK